MRPTDEEGLDGAGFVAMLIAALLYLLWALSGAADKSK